MILTFIFCVLQWSGVIHVSWWWLLPVMCIEPGFTVTRTTFRGTHERR